VEFKSKEREGILNKFSNLKPTQFDKSAKYKQLQDSKINKSNHNNGGIE